MKYRFVVILSALVAMPMFAVAILAATGSFEERVLPVYGQVPDFSLTERHGTSIERSFFGGKVWVAGFVFTRCTEQCPLITGKMQRIQNKLRFKENFRLVSITVDPQRDTPEVLAQYADKVSADPYKWLFLTGTQSQINSLVQNGFRLPSAGSDGEVADAIHSSKLVLIDHGGRIRGYYDAYNDDEMKNLLKDAKALIKKAF